MSSRSAKTAGECVKPRVLCAMAVSSAIAFITIGIYAAAGAGPVCPVATEGGNGGRQMPLAVPAAVIKLGHFYPKETLQADCWKAAAVTIVYEYHQAEVGDEKIVQGLIETEIEVNSEMRKNVGEGYLPLKLLKGKYKTFAMFLDEFDDARKSFEYLSTKVGVAFKFEFTTKDFSGHEEPKMTTVVQEPKPKPNVVRTATPMVTYKVVIIWSTVASDVVN